MDSRAQLISAIIAGLEVTHMSYGTVTFKFNTIPSVNGPFAKELVETILDEASLKIMAEAMIFPVELLDFVFDYNKQEAKGLY